MHRKKVDMDTGISRFNIILTLFSYKNLRISFFLLNFAKDFNEKTNFTHYLLNKKRIYEVQKLHRDIQQGTQ